MQERSGTGDTRIGVDVEYFIDRRQTAGDKPPSSFRRRLANRNRRQAARFIGSDEPISRRFGSAASSATRGTIFGCFGAIIMRRDALFTILSKPREKRKTPARFWTDQRKRGAANERQFQEASREARIQSNFRPINGSGKPPTSGDSKKPRAEARTVLSRRRDQEIKKLGYRDSNPD